MANGSNPLLQRYLEPLLQGRRQECRSVVEEAINSGSRAEALYRDLVWPAMQRVDHLFRQDMINVAAEHMATRINRTIAERLRVGLEHQEQHDKRVLITCAAGEAEEISAQMTADLFEADGWDVYFVGGGVPQDEIVNLVGQLRPDLLIIIGSKPEDAPGVRQLIDYLREINACPHMNVMVSGGVFNRATELWKEVKADLFAETATDALATAKLTQPREPELRVPGAPKKRRRRRRPPLLEQMELAAR